MTLVGGPVAVPRGTGIGSPVGVRAHPRRAAVKLSKARQKAGGQTPLPPCSEALTEQARRHVVDVTGGGVRVLGIWGQKKGGAP